MLFGVSDEIQDITRRSGIVWRIRFIYGKLFLGFRKSSGFFRYCTEKVLEGSGGPLVGPTYLRGVHMD